MSKQKVMKDLDALLADLQSTTEHNCSSNNNSNGDNVVDKSTLPLVDSEGQPVYEVQNIRTTTSSAVPHSSPKTNNLSELDSLLSELSSVRLSSVVDSQLSTPSLTHKLDAPPGAASSATKELDQLMDSLSDLSTTELKASYAVPNKPFIKSHQLKQSADKSNVQPANERQDMDRVTIQSAAVNQDRGVATAVSQSQKANLNIMLQDLNKDLVQHGISTTTKGLCSACNKAIVGQVITALGRLYHPEHFCCAHCQQPIGTQNFFERDGQPYCEEDYYKVYSPKCGLCDKPVVDKCVLALDKAWHPEHFCCNHCGQELGQASEFNEKDGYVYCSKDYYELFAPKCGSCDQPIKSDFITAINKQWHTSCFCCHVCKAPFGVGNFFDDDGFPYCETHFHAKRGSLCVVCNKPITGRCIAAMSRKFHPEHFVCTFCQKQLNKGTFKEQNDKPYCHPCFVRLFN